MDARSRRVEGATPCGMDILRRGGLPGGGGDVMMVMVGGTEYSIVQTQRPSSSLFLAVPKWQTKTENCRKE